MESYANPYLPVAQAEASARAKFIQNTYLHTAGAIFAFIGIEWALLQMPFATNLAKSMTSGMSWLIVLAAFMAVSWIADKWASSNNSRGMQYAGLALFTVAEAVIFLPLILFATTVQMVKGTPLIAQAGIVTMLLVAGVTAVAFVTKKDFSFLRGFLTIAFFIALGVIVAGVIFGFTLGIAFSAIMALIAGGSILYTTSDLQHHTSLQYQSVRRSFVGFIFRNRPPVLVCFADFHEPRLTASRLALPKILGISPRLSDWSELRSSNGRTFL